MLPIHIPTAWKVAILSCLMIIPECAAQQHHVPALKVIDHLRGQGEEMYGIDFDSTRAIYLEIFRIAKQEDLVLEQLEAIYNLCFCADYHEQMAAYQKYIAWGRQFMKEHVGTIQTKDKSGIHRASMIQAFGMYAYTLGDYDGAIAAFSRVVNLNGSPLTKDSSTIMYIGAYLGQSWFNVGNLDKAYQFFEMTRRYIPRNQEDYTYNEALFLMYETECLVIQNNYADALDRVQQSLQLLKTEPDPAAIRNSLISNYKLAARIYLEKGDPGSAEKMVATALRLHKKEDPNYPATYRFLADILYQNHQPDSALNYYIKSNRLFNKTFPARHPEKVQALMGIGNVYRDRKHFEKAAAYYLECFNNLAPEQMPNRAMQVMLEQGRLYFDWYKSAKTPSLLEPCIAALNRALQLNDNSRRELITMESKELRARVQGEITELGVKACYHGYGATKNPAYLERAFGFIEKSRANILLDRASEVRALGYAGIPGEILDKEKRLKGEISIYRNQMLRVGKPPDYTAAAGKQYNDKLREYTGLVSELETRYPRYFRLKYNAAAVGAEAVQTRMKRDHALLVEYFMGQDSIYIAAVSGRRLFIKVTARDEVLERHIALLLRQLAEPNVMEYANDTALFGAFTRSARVVYLQLLAPVLDAVGNPVRELIVVPDGMLCYLPFEVLLTEPVPSGTTGYGSLPYLIRKFPVRYDYSATLAIEETSGSRLRTISYAGFAPDFSTLVANRKEVEACRRLLHGRIWTGDAATEQEFRRAAGQTGILHLATHSIANDADPQDSYILFSLPAGGDDDGMLHTGELYSMNLSARLAILSGCETGIGHFRKGEGMLSLARAFKYAGCRNILMSLWRVNDESTRKVIVSFCKYLKQGCRKSEALRRAKIRYLKDSGNLHPAYWSSFVLIGDNEAVGNRHSVWLYVIPGILLAGGMLLWLRRKSAP